MKKKYLKPSLMFEKIETENVMNTAWSNGTADNALSFNSALNNTNFSEYTTGTINFENGSAYNLGSIDYSQFQ